MSSDVTILAPSVPELRTRVHLALAAWYRRSQSGNPLAGLALVHQTQIASGLDADQAAKQVLLTCLEELATSAPSEVDLLRRRFLDDRPVFVVARELNVAEATLYKRQRQALSRLATLMVNKERLAKADQITAAELRLPPIDYQRLFGVEPMLSQLAELLTSADPPWMILLHGIGGQGKTTLARSALDRVIHGAATAVDVGWVSAQQHLFGPNGVISVTDTPVMTIDDLLLALWSQLLPVKNRSMPFLRETAMRALQSLLREVPHLVVIDNLETIVEVEALMPELRRLAGPSRFLLTSRQSLPGAHDLYHVSVPELSPQDALDMVRFEAQMRNLTAINQASDADLRPIVDTVGGNPLALKLVAGQLYFLSLPEVVTNLRRARGKKATDLYRYVYWQAWSQLSSEGQEVLLCMPMFAQGGADLATIEQVSDIKGGRLRDALEQLANLSLINVSGDLWTRRYGIHRLTETFLLHEVVQWRGQSLGWENEPSEQGLS